jgi:hypothetical protein
MMTTPLTVTQSTPTAVKSTLARLLATENIFVTHENIPTAFFDLKTRSLHLPLWSTTSGCLYDMLVGHEVAHALFTPTEGWRSAIERVAAETGCSNTTAKQYVNIVEDARIERLIQNKFRGLKADFISAYKTLMERKFFGDLSKIDSEIFADRFNIHFKCGVHAGMNLQFTPEENVLITRGSSITTWDEVVSLATDMIRFAKQKSSKNESPDTVDTDSNTKSEHSSDSDSQDTTLSDSESNTSETNETSKPNEPSETNKTNSSDVDTCSDADATTTFKVCDENGDTNITPFTNKQLEEQLKTLSETDTKAPSAVIHIPCPDTDSSKVVIPFTRIIADLSATAFSQRYTGTSVKIADYDSAAVSMATAFNRRKAADMFRRSTISKSGSLDSLRMNQYKWTDDIFRKVTRVAEGKNHGIVILLDWSGSMTRIMQSTMGQLFILSDFCRKVGIPFEVYGFSTVPYTQTQEDESHKSEEKTSPSIHLGTCTLLNFFSSKMTAIQYETMKSMMWNWREMGSYDGRYTLSSTPTTAALMYTSDIVKKFQAATGVQIMHTVVLTDGDPTDGFHVSRLRDASRNFLSTAVVMGDSLTGATYDITQYRLGAKRNYGNLKVVFETPDRWGHEHSAIALDVLRRRTGSKVHWVGLTLLKRVDPKTYGMTVGANQNFARDGFIRGSVHGWDSAVVVDAKRFLRNSDGSVHEIVKRQLQNVQTRMSAAESKREIQKAFIDSQLAAGSLRTLANIIGEHLAAN